MKKRMVIQIPLYESLNSEHYCILLEAVDVETDLVHSEQQDGGFEI